jgi:hypothetical protein
MTAHPLIGAVRYESASGLADGLPMICCSRAGGQLPAKVSLGWPVEGVAGGHSAR